MHAVWMHPLGVVASTAQGMPELELPDPMNRVTTNYGIARMSGRGWETAANGNRPADADRSPRGDPYGRFMAVASPVAGAAFDGPASRSFSMICFLLIRSERMIGSLGRSAGKIAYTGIER